LPVIVLAGEEEFLISRRVRSLKERLVDPSWESFNFARLEGGADLKQVIDVAGTVPFGPGNRMVLIDQCALFTKKRGGKDDSESSSATKSNKLAEDFESALAMVAENTFLIFACIANFDRSLKTSKAVEKHGEIISFEKFKYYTGSESSKLISFANEEVHKYGAVIDDDAVYYLAESTETNLRQIAADIEKAAIYILPEKRIRLEHVTLLSPHFSDVFALLGFWAQGEKGKVLLSLQELKSRQVSPHMVVAAMQTMLSKWIYYKSEHEKMMTVATGGRDVGRREMSLRQVAERIDSRSAFMIEKDLRKIKSLSLSGLVKKKQELVDLEQLVKTGQMPETHVLEVFFTR